MFGFWKKPKQEHVSFDEILLDSSNLPAFNQGRMEGRMELPITKRNVMVVGVIFVCIALLFLSKLFHLQVTQGAYYLDMSENNTINRSVIIAERGVVYDRQGEMVAWNEHDTSDINAFPERAYTDREGLGQLVGYISYPQKDSKGFYYRTEYIGRNGVEASYNDLLSGENGEQLIETDALGNVLGEHVVDLPTAGSELHLSIDAELSEAMYDIIATSSANAGFRSGAGAIMDVKTGEIIAMTSFPSYDPEVMSDGDDVDLIASYNEDDRFPFLNKVFAGVYTPGSIVKPFMAYAALVEDVISPDKTIVSTGEIVIPNPYNPENPSRFTDWRAHGKMTMREAIAFSSNVYFYYISGGFGDQKGMGIAIIDKYMDLFGFGNKTGIILANEQPGTVPSPEWKEETFDEAWRLGDTYNTSIGQFGWQVTPLQMVRAFGALANGGRFFTPHVEKNEMGEYYDVALDSGALNVIHEGMRMTVDYPGGTARSFERLDTVVAAKSGTAEVGAGNAYVNSWAAGFFPYDEPRYSFILMMDKAPRSNQLGATTIMSNVIEWMEENRPEYVSVVDEENKEN